MQVNEVIQNFTILSSQPVEELEATLWLMEHKKSGARLVWLDRKDENKTFGIAFQTQPWDDTGVFHILEHSVLCGSEKFPVKEPFVELLKSSLNTYLNAATFPDKTMYPVSSRNDQDLLNLMRVYMDAVLHPLIHQKPEIFGQEGWHYELSEDGKASYKGVVFNEMKGAYSSPDSLLIHEMSRRLFPDNCYQYESGGHPEHIPELSYEDFAAAHKRLYHPSNSYIFLDGSIQLEQVLSILDGEFLCEFGRIPTPGNIPIQQPVDGGTAEIRYELSSQEELAGRARLALGRVACTYQDREILTGMQALSDVLCGDNQAPLKRRLLEAGLARDVSINVYDVVQQPWFWLEARDISEEKFGEAEAALTDEAEKLCRDGLDHKRILATLDNMEFQARQRDYGGMPQGLAFGLQVLDSWLYGGDPAANLSVGTLYDDLREKCEQGWFEELLRKIFLDNPHRCRVLMRPSHTLGKERQEQEEQRLQAARSGWDQAAEDAARQRQERIEGWQNTPDSPEALAAIPMLRLDQIPQEPEALPMEVGEQRGITVLRHRLATGGITYLNLYFDLADLPAAQLTQAAFLARLLGSLETEAYELKELQRKMRSLFGQIQFSVEPYGAKGDPARYRAFLCASVSVLDSKLEKALGLLTELLAGTKWNDPKKVYELVCQQRAAMAEQITMMGHLAAMRRARACCAAGSAVEETCGGVEFLRWLKDLEEGFDGKFPALAGKLEALAAKIFSMARLTISATGSKEDAAATAQKILSERLPKGSFTAPEAPAVRAWGKRREGIVIPADVSFAGLAGWFGKTGGQAKVAAQAASLGYLWNAVRVQGGAYGVGMTLTATGLGCFYSFRDPSAARTLDCYAAAAGFLRGAGEMDLTGMIIGTVAETDPLLSPRMKGKIADVRYWQGISEGDLRRERQEILAARPEDLVRLAGQVEELVNEGAVCVLGSQKHIDACEGKLDSVSAL